MLLASRIGRTKSWSLALGAASTVIGCGGSRAAPTPEMLAQRPDLSGQWEYNADESDDVRAILREGMSDAQQGDQQPSGGRTGGRRGGGRPTGAADGRTRGAATDPVAMRQRMEAALRAPPILRLAQDDTTITVIENQGVPVVLHTDNRKTELTTGTGSNVEFRAKWEDRDLVVEQKFAAAKVTMEYFLSQTTDQLFVVVKVEPDRTQGTFEFRRVYDPVELP